MVKRKKDETENIQEFLNTMGQINKNIMVLGTAIGKKLAMLTASVGLLWIVVILGFSYLFFGLGGFFVVAFILTLYLLYVTFKADKKKKEALAAMEIASVTGV